MLKLLRGVACIVALGLLSGLAAAPASLAAGAPQEAQEAVSLVGDWEGTLSLPDGRNVEMVFHVVEAEGGALSATMDVPAQGASGIACPEVTIEGADLHISGCGIPGGGGYDGSLNESGSGLEGNFNQAGMSFPLELTAASSEDGS